MSPISIRCGPVTGMLAAMDRYEEVGGDAQALAELAARLDGWRPDQIGTLMFLREGGRVLLIEKRRGHGAGKINGPGGKPERGETPRDCVVRETREEVGVTPLDPHLAGVFRFVDQADEDWLGFIYVASAYRGAPHATAEAIPAWYPIDRLPLDRMWDDDRYWLPRVLNGERLVGDFLFRGGRLLGYRLHRLGAGEPFPDTDDGSA